MIMDELRELQLIRKALEVMSFRLLIGVMFLGCIVVALVRMGLKL